MDEKGVAVMTEFNAALGRRIRRYRRMNRLSQGAVAQALGLSFQQTQKYELGINRVSCETLVRLALVLRVGPMDLLADSPDDLPKFQLTRMDVAVADALCSCTERQKKALLGVIATFNGKEST